MFSTALILQTFFAAVKLQKEECMKDRTKSKIRQRKGREQEREREREREREIERESISLCERRRRFSRSVYEREKARV